MNQNLSPKEISFVNEYIKNGRNGTKAALAVGLASTDNSVAVVASRLLRNAKIVEHLNNESKSVSEAVRLDKEPVMTQLARIITTGRDCDRIAGFKVWAELTGENQPRAIRLLQQVSEAPKTPEEIDEILRRMKKSAIKLEPSDTQSVSNPA